MQAGGKGDEARLKEMCSYLNSSIFPQLWVGGKKLRSVEGLKIGILNTRWCHCVKCISAKFLKSVKVKTVFKKLLGNMC